MKRFWFNNGNEEILLRNDKYIPEGFIPGRLKRSPSKLDLLCNRFSKEFIYRKYIIDNISFINLSVELQISSNDLRKLLSAYKIKKDPKQARKNNLYIRDEQTIRLVAEKSSVTQKNSWGNKSEEEKEAWRAKQREVHGTDSFRKKISIINKEYQANLRKENPDLYKHRNEKRRESCKRIWAKNGVEIQQRRKITEKKNRLAQKNKLCRTISEQKLYDVLIQLYPDLLYDVKVDDRYPFYCDFYIPSKDIFIELQAHPSHGRLPMENLSFEEYSKYPVKFIDVFAKRDVHKLDVARINGINLVRIYPSATIEENYIINHNIEKDIIDICYQSQK